MRYTIRWIFNLHRIPCF